MIEGMLSKGDVDAAGDQVVDRQRPAAIGDVVSISTLASRLNSSPDRCSVVPLPDEGVGHLAPVVVAIGDELGHRFRRLRQRHAQSCWAG